MKAARRPTTRSHPLDPAIEEILDDIDPDAPGMDELSLSELRASIEDMRQWHGPDAAVLEARRLTIDGPGGPLELRIYVGACSGPRPVALFTFGGGFITGSLDFAEGPARLMAAESGGVVVSVGYRLAPEHPFPAGLEDSYAALRWVDSQLGALGGDGRLVVVGDSSGGNFAAALAMMARDRGGPRLAHQVLVYPVLDDDFEAESYRAYGDGYFLTADAMAYFWRSYLPSGVNHDQPYVAPGRCADLHGLPPATILLCEADPLSSEGERYAARLMAAGVDAEVVRFADLVHGSFHMAGISASAQELVVRAARAIRDA
jgi:acetyl esterase